MSSDTNNTESGQTSHETDHQTDHHDTDTHIPEVETELHDPEFEQTMKRRRTITLATVGMIILGGGGYWYHHKHAQPTFTPPAMPAMPKGVPMQKGTLAPKGAPPPVPGTHDSTQPQPVHPTDATTAGATGQQPPSETATNQPPANDQPPTNEQSPAGANTRDISEDVESDFPTGQTENEISFQQEPQEQAPGPDLSLSDASRLAKILQQDKLHPAQATANPTLPGDLSPTAEKPPVLPNLTFAGVMGSTIFVRFQSTNTTKPYHIGDDIPSAGKITSFTTDGQTPTIHTEKGLILAQPASNPSPVPADADQDDR